MVIFMGSLPALKISLRIVVRCDSTIAQQNPLPSGFQGFSMAYSRGFASELAVISGMP
jgi:hypothetical protein